MPVEILYPSLKIVGILTVIGVVLVSAIGLLRSPDPEKYKSLWHKFLMHMLIMFILVSIGVFGEKVFFLFCLLLSWGAWRDLLDAIARHYGELPQRKLLMFLGILGVTGAASGQLVILFATAAAAIWLAVMLPMIATQRPPALHGTMAVALGTAIITLPLGLLHLLASQSYGLYVFLIIVLMSHDGFCEGLGRLLGNQAIWPHISPAKTWGGSIGGLVAGVTVAYFLQFAAPQWDLWQLLGLSAGLLIVAGLGDLAASSIKRQVGIKDFSDLIPAHGGVLDRFDSLLFTIPVFYLVAIASGMV